MATKQQQLDELGIKVTDLNVRMINVERQQSIMDDELHQLTASMNKYAKKRKFLSNHMKVIAICTTILIIITIILLHILK